MKRQTWICKGFDVLSPCTNNRRFEYKVNAKSIDEAKRKVFIRFRTEHPNGCFVYTILKRV